jgi:hypothetical protein
MAATATRQRRLVEAVVEAVRTGPPPVRSPSAEREVAKNEVYSRLSLAIRRRDKERARLIYYDEILPDRRFSRGEVLRLSYRLGVIDEGDRYLAERADL